MLLAVDTGNTNTVFAVFDEDGAIRGEWRAATDVNRTADEMGVYLDQVLRLDGLDRTMITAGIVASVVPATVFALRTLFRKYFHCQAMVVGSPEVQSGVKVLLDRPDEVGADRIVNAVGAFEHFGGPRIIVDFGTATTLDVIDGEGNYLGGVICPGVNLSIAALHQAAAQLPRVAIGRPERVIGKTTVQAMRSGIYWGYLGMIEALIERIRRELDNDIPVTATGGLAPLFGECSLLLQHNDPELTLKGLYTVYRRNVPR